MNEIMNKIIKWADSIGLLKQNPTSQLTKIMEELGEVTQAYHRQTNLEEELGDLIVTITIFAEQNDINLEEATSLAYNKIMGRSGKIVNGSFVKEADL